MRKFLVRLLVPSPELTFGAVAFLAVLGNPGNADVIWHMAIGRAIVQGGAIPDLSRFYYTPSPSAPVDLSWLSQVVLYLTHHHLGAAGIAVLNALAAGGVFFLLARMLSRASRNLLLNMVILGVAFGATSPYLDSRPVVFTILLLAVFLTVIDAVGRGRRGWAWLLPPLTVLWVNLHPGFIVAPLVVAAALAFRPRERGLWAGVLAATVAAVAINPATWRLYLLPYEMVRSAAMLSGLTEWSSLRGPGAAYLAVLLALLSFQWARRRPAAFDVALCLGTAAAAVAAYRNIALFGVAAAWSLGRAGKLPERLMNMPVVRRFNVDIEGTGGWAWALMVPLALLATNALPFGYRLDLKTYPVAAVQYLKASPVPGNVFVREPWSGYLLWEMPGVKLFFDAKGGFDPAAIKDHYELAKPGPKWREVADRYKVGALLLETGSPLAVVLNETSDWVQAHGDSVAVLYVKKRASYE